MNQALFLSFPGVLGQLPRIADRVSGVGDEELAVVHHVSVGPDDCQLPRDGLHPWRIKGAVETGGGKGPLRWMVGPQIEQQDIRVLLLRLPDGLCRQQVKPTIIANHKLIHAILHDACLYRGGQGGEYAVWSIPVTNEKAGTGP